MIHPLALAWRFLLVISLALNPLVGLRAAEAAAMPCQQHSAGDMADMADMAMPIQSGVGDKSDCPAGSGCKMPGCDFAACCGPFVLSLAGPVGAPAHMQPGARLPVIVVHATPAPDLEALIRPPIA